MQKFNKRRKLDRFLASLPEDMVFKSNNELLSVLLYLKNIFFNYEKLII